MIHELLNSLVKFHLLLNGNAGTVNPGEPSVRLICLCRIKPYLIVTVYVQEPPVSMSNYSFKFSIFGIYNSGVRFSKLVFSRELDGES